MSRYPDEFDDRGGRDDRDDDRYDDRPGGRGGATVERAKSLVKTPAVLLLVAGILSVLYALLLAVNIFTLDAQFAQVEQQWDNDPNLNPQQRQDMKKMLADWKGPAKVMVPVIALSCGLTGLISILVAIKMMSLSGRGLATLGAVLSMIPVVNACCCVLGLPIGIWCLVVLAKPEVKAGFAAVAAPRDEY
jgi:hypothetical protein